MITTGEEWHNGLILKRLLSPGNLREQVIELGILENGIWEDNEM